MAKKLKTSLLKNLIFALRYGFRGVPCTINGYDLRLDESLRRWNLNAEAPMQKVISELLRTGDFFVDVGANFGLHTLLAAKIVGDKGKIIAVEPVPANLKLLKRNIQLNNFEKFVSIFPYALIESAHGQVVMNVDDGLSVAASLSSAKKKCKIIRVQSSTLDNCLRDTPFPPKLIKIDVEGAEHEVLKGAQETLSRFKPYLLIEVHSFALPEFGSSAEILSDFLNSIGYSKEIISETHGTDGEYYHALFSPVAN